MELRTEPRSGARAADRATRDRPTDPAARAAARAFAGALVVAFPLLLWLGNQRWFSTDEWGFLISYSLRDPAGLFAPQNGHWSTLPVIAFQGLFEVIGVRSYAAYQVMSVAMHLAAVAVVRVVMRRAGVRPWVATLAALTLLLFGNGQQNIFVAIQISFVGAFVLGVGQVLLADHDGPVSWRDGLGVLAGIAALACSAVGIVMIPVVAIAVVLRRGWRIAALHVVPVVAVYATWYAIERPATTAGGATDSGLFEVLGKVARWDLIGQAATFRDLAANPWLGIVLGCVGIAGLVVAWRGGTWAWFRRTQGAPVALLVGGLVFLSITGASRWRMVGTDAAGDQSRYLYMVAAFTIPALGVAFDALAQRWRVAVPALAGLFAVGLVGNLLAFRAPTPYIGQELDHFRDVVLSAARSPQAPLISPNVRVDPAGAFNLEIGWLLAAERDGKLPAAAPVDPNIEAELAVRLGLRQGLFGPQLASCTSTEQITLTPAKGQVHRIVPGPGAAIGVRAVDAAGAPTSPQVVFLGPQGRFFTAELPDQRFVIATTEPGTPLEICS